MTKNIERIDAVFARGGVKSAKRNVFQSLACIISIPPAIAMWMTFKKPSAHYFNI